MCLYCLFFSHDPRGFCERILKRTAYCVRRHRTWFAVIVVDLWVPLLYPFDMV